jgi:hypothetical protein
MAFDAGAVVGRAIFDDSKWKSGIKSVESSNKGMTKSIFLAQAAYDAFKKVLSGTINVVKQSIGVARDFAEENSKFQTVFKDVGSSAQAMRQELINAYGLSKKASTELLAATGDLLSGFGFTQESALELSSEVQKLAVDLASFTNFSGGAEGASQALTKALLGERESVKSLGISIMEADVQAKILELTQQGLTFETERQAKAYATLLIAQDQSINAQGDFARTSDQLANRQRQLTAVTEDLQVQIGTIFTPILNEFAGSALEAAKGMRDFLDSAEGLEILSSIFGGIKAAIEIAFDVIEKFGKILKEGVLDAIEDLTPSFQDLFKELQGNVTAFDIFAAVLETVGIGLTIAVKLLKTFIQSNIDLLRVIKETVKALVLLGQALFDPTKWKEVGKQLGTLTETFVDMGKNIKDNVVDIVETAINEFGELPDRIGETAKETEKVWSDTFARNKKAFEDHIKDMNNIQKQGGAEVTGTQETWLSKMKANMEKFKEDFKKGWEESGKEALSIVSSLLQDVAGVMNDVFGLVDMGFQNEIDRLKLKHEEENEELENQKETKMENLVTEFEERSEELEMQREQGLIGQEEFDMAMVELEQNRKDQENNINETFTQKQIKLKKKQLAAENEAEKKAFNAEKANKIANVWIQMAIGTIAAWAGAFQSIPNPIAAAVVGAIMSTLLLGNAIASTVLISQQQFIPKKARGGIASGLTRINEEGGELVSLPDGAVVVPNDISRQIAMNAGGGMQQTTINVSFAGAKITDNMSLRKVSDFVISDMAKQLRLST